MIVSWNWLKRYLDLDVDANELADRLSLSGLNHEGSETVYDDLAVDLEVTSNRPDCLGHVGVAREISVLYNLPLSVPDPQPKATESPVDSLTSVDLRCADLCTHYTARLIKGVKVGPSPEWLVELLRNRSGNPDEFKSINNVADITNFVMLECGQPLHAFDFDQLDGSKVIVRNAAKGERLNTIDHKDIDLTPSMCVIADASKPIALAGIMGGSSTEISDDTVNVLVEAAVFAPVGVRNTSRALKLASDSSYRFERRVDPEGVDWASRRCCDLILELCGGRLCEGVIDQGQKAKPAAPFVLRIGQVERILGMKVPADEIVQILTALGNTVLGNTVEPGGDAKLKIQPPSWRGDLTREVDLIEEIARIHGYDKIPEDRSVSMAISSPPPEDIAFGRLRSSMTAFGFSEALSPSLVPPELSDLYSPWSDQPAMITSQPMSGVLDTKFWSTAGPVHCVRRSLLPSLLELRRLNEYRHTQAVNLFEIAKVYLPKGAEFPVEKHVLGVTTGRDLLEAKSQVLAVLASLGRAAKISVRPFADPFFAAGKAIHILADGEVVGLLGQVSKATMKKLKMRRDAVVGEIFVDGLVQTMVEIPQAIRQSPYPPIQRDLNFIVDTCLHWAKLEQTVRDSGGPLLENVAYRETFVDEKRDGEGKKRLLLEITLRSSEGTLTGQQAEEVSSRVIESCQKECGAKLVS